jgi:hypothetical protein
VKPDDLLGARRVPPDGLRSGGAVINGKTVRVEWTAPAEDALRSRGRPLIVELELYFSCLVKKFVHVREAAGGHALAWVDDRLALYFRPVTSTTCTPQTAERLGRQPEVEIDTPATRRMAPKRVLLDFRDGAWNGTFWL